MNNNEYPGERVGHKQLLVVGPQLCQSTICLQQMRHNGARQSIWNGARQSIRVRVCVCVVRMWICMCVWFRATVHTRQSHSIMDAGIFLTLLWKQGPEIQSWISKLCFLISRNY